MSFWAPKSVISFHLSLTGEKYENQKWADSVITSAPKGPTFYSQMRSIFIFWRFKTLNGRLITILVNSSFYSQNRYIARRQQYQFESNLGKQKRYTYTRIFHRYLLNRSMDPGLIGGYCRFIFITKNSRARKHCPIWSYTAINFIHSDQKKQNKKHLLRFKQGYIVEAFYLW